MSSSSADRNLLFGIQALQRGLVTRDALLAAMQAWATNQTKPLGLLLVEQGALGPDQRSELESALETNSREQTTDAAPVLLASSPNAPTPQERALLGETDSYGGIVTERYAEASPGNGVATPGSASTNPQGMRYRVLRPHAKGGLGEVFVALDEELNREVALKQIQGRFADSADSRRRFVLEAEVTGSLEHPGVVPVYGLGAYADGSPYYAMRFIKGKSLARAILDLHQKGSEGAARALALRGLLGRFVGVCNAVAYAHSRGVIHRDLKPDNVMLGAFGETLVVDWGLAKVVQGSKQGRTRPEETRDSSGLAENIGTVGAVGTPAYMSPEQAAGRQSLVGPASDVYSLGATLYALLTGQKPIRAGRIDEALDKVQRGEIVPPRQHSRDVPRALEAICLKAMALRPEARYASALELAAEVERWLSDAPVSADREPWRERAARWARRHRTLVSGSIVLLLVSTLALGVGLAAVKAEETRTAEQRDAANRNWEVAESNRLEAETNLAQAQANRKEAERNLERAEANLKLAKNAVDDCYWLATKSPLLQQESMREVRELLLKKALPFYKGFQAQRPDDRGIQEERAEQFFRVAFIINEIGSKSEALKFYAQARDVQTQLVKAHRTVLPHYQALAGTLNNIGLLQRDLGQRKAALKSFEQALAIQVLMAKDHPGVVEYQFDVARTLNNRGLLQRDLGRQESALKSFEQARAIQTILVKDHPRASTYKQGLATSCNNLGWVLHDLGQLPPALRFYEQARNLQAELVKEHPQVAEHRHGLAKAHHNLAGLQRELRQPQAALKSYQQAREIQTALLKEHPKVSSYQHDLATAHNSLGILQLDLGQRELALKSFEQARDIQKQLVKAHPKVTAHRQELGVTYSNLGVVQLALGQREAASRSFQLARDILAKLAAQHPEVLAHHLQLGQTCVLLGSHERGAGKRTDSLASYTAGINALETARKRIPNHAGARDLLIRAHSGRAIALGDLGRHREAVADWDRVFLLWPPNTPHRFRMDRAYALARAGAHARTVAEAAVLARTDPSAGPYDLACLYALASGAVATDLSVAEEERDCCEEGYALCALAFLAKARTQGFFKGPDNLATLRTDTDLDPLRDRDDFKQFVAAVQAPPKKPSK